jgi:hypothetical protein
VTSTEEHELSGSKGTANLVMKFAKGSKKEVGEEALHGYAGNKCCIGNLVQWRQLSTPLSACTWTRQERRSFDWPRATHRRMPPNGYAPWCMLADGAAAHDCITTTTTARSESAIPDDSPLHTGCSPLQPSNPLQFESTPVLPHTNANRALLQSSINVQEVKGVTREYTGRLAPSARIKGTASASDAPQIACTVRHMRLGLFALLSLGQTCRLRDSKAW